MRSTLATTSGEEDKREHQAKEHKKVRELGTTGMAERWKDMNVRVQLDDHSFGPSRAQVLTLARLVDECKDVGQNCEQTHLRDLAESKKMR